MGTLSCFATSRSYAPSMPLRILTINLYNGRATADSFATALAQTQPDLVATQELTAPAADVMADWGSAHLLDPRDDTTGMGVAARFPAEFERLDFPHRDPIRARFDGIRWGFREVEVVDSHVVNPISRPLLQSKRLRELELAALEQLLAEPVASRILVGDMNSSPAWPLYRRLAALATDGALAAGTARRTWGYWPRSPRMLRIDHAFLQGATCVRTSLVQVAGGDHRGLLVEVEPD